MINLIASEIGGGNIQAFKTMRTLRALRPLRALSRFQGMRVSAERQTGIPPSQVILFLFKREGGNLSHEHIGDTLHVLASISFFILFLHSLFLKILFIYFFYHSLIIYISFLFILFKILLQIRCVTFL